MKIIKDTVVDRLPMEAIKALRRAARIENKKKDRNRVKRAVRREIESENDTHN